MVVINQKNTNGKESKIRKRQRKNDDSPISSSQYNQKHLQAAMEVYAL